MSKLLILYHFYHPDDVVSATHFTEFCEGMSSRGHEVEVWPANRTCHQSSINYGVKPENVNGVKIHRIWRPNFNQHSFIGRILNSFWMQKAWWWRLAFTPSYEPDLILLGTDPIFAIMIAPWFRLIRPNVKIVHWVYDMHPEAAIADGLVGLRNPLLWILEKLMRKGYRSSDLTVDIGPCMRKRLAGYPYKNQATLTPWALEEPLGPLPINIKERESLFGEAKIGLLYSGSFGRAHNFYLTLKLARQMKGFGVVVTYSVRGSRLGDLKEAVNAEDTNIRFVDFAPSEKLLARLSAPDVHIVSLRPEWSGIVVPSKFFGALAVGRPVLFEGPKDSDVAQWIKDYQVGWVLEPENMKEVQTELLRFLADPAKKAEMFKHCHRVYQRYFSKKAVLDAWADDLKTLLV